MAWPLSGRHELGQRGHRRCHSHELAGCRPAGPKLHGIASSKPCSAERKMPEVAFLGAGWADAADAAFSTVLIAARADHGIPVCHNESLLFSMYFGIWMILGAQTSLRP
jgi:hypothetical protein